MELNGKAIKKLDLTREWTLRHNNKAKEILKNSIGGTLPAEMMWNLNIENEVLALVFKYEHETKFNEVQWQERAEAFLDIMIDEDMKEAIKDFFGLVVESITKDTLTYLAKVTAPNSTKTTS
jgi:hypothetical protein